MIQEHNGIKYKFFWSGIFSNWHISDFIVDGVSYSSGEQYMMYQKALTFNDIETADEILEEIMPNFQKQLGRKIKNFDSKIWNDVKYELIKKGLREKFSQNSNLKLYLLKYKDYQIVEASPEDKIWGIGFYANLAISNIDFWGENLLGKILTELAQEIK